jgi:hypothetical protein
MQVRFLPGLPFPEQCRLVRVCLVACSLATCSSRKSSDCICSEIRLHFLKDFTYKSFGFKDRSKNSRQAHDFIRRGVPGRKHRRGEGSILPADPAVVECPLLRKNSQESGHPRIPPLRLRSPSGSCKKQRATSGTALLARPTPASRKSLRTSPGSRIMKRHCAQIFNRSSAPQRAGERHRLVRAA